MPQSGHWPQNFLRCTTRLFPRTGGRMRSLLRGAHMRRRDFVTLLGGVAVGWPLAARAQQRAMPVIGFLHSSSPEPLAVQVAAFREGLKQTGFVEGQNVTIEYRWAHNENARLPELALDLVR